MPNFTEKDVATALEAAGIDLVQLPKAMRILEGMRDGSIDPETGQEIRKSDRKDTVPSRPLYGSRIFENGPFSLIDNDLFSNIASGGSAIMRWIPTATMRSRRSHVAHLDWVAPEGYLGDTTYPEYLAGISIGECGYGPSTVWSGFSYQMSSGSFSWTTTSMRPYEDGGLHYYEEMPVYAVRGENLNMPVISSDAEWAIARVIHIMETHLDFVLKHGDRANSEMEFDGLDVIVRPGFVASHIYGTGTPTWADPVFFNGAALNDAGTLLRKIRAIIRLIRKRARDRNWTLAPSDMVLYMGTTMWDQLSEFVAMGAAFQYTNTYGFTGEQSFRDFRAEYRETRQGGVGFGTIDIDGTPVPVLTDSNLGAGTTLDTGSGGVDAITGDIYILTRRAGGMSFLMQEYLDWGDLDYPAKNRENHFLLQGGLVRSGWVEESNKCYYYYGEMVGRLICTMLPMQGRLTNVTIPVLDVLEHEAAAFWNPDFYAFRAQGVQGQQGTELLNPI